MKDKPTLLGQIIGAVLLAVVTVTFIELANAGLMSLAGGCK